MDWTRYPTVIKDNKIQLEPLTMAIFTELTSALLPDPDGWYQVMFGLSTPELVRAEIVDAEAGFETRTTIGFAIRELKAGCIAGMSQFMKIDIENRHLEIGNSMIGPAFRQTHVNTHTKALMLTEAFEVMGMNRVSFRIDEENLGSRRAVERIGATLGGKLRAERILPDGRIRDYCFYSIVEAEWAHTKARLKQLSSSTQL